VTAATERSGLRAPRLYRTTVMHTRHGSKSYRFRHRTFRLLLDIDRLDETAALVRGLAHNRTAPVSVHDRDFGPRDGSPLRPWIDKVLAEAGFATPPARVLLLCYPRLFGYQFNPLSLWFCEDAAGAATAVLCEVHSTFGESHGYLLHQDGRAFDGDVQGDHDKAFHVSPFIDMHARYRFNIRADADSLRIGIRESDAFGETLLVASEQGHGRSLTAGALFASCAAMPLMGFRIVAMIHWHGLKLWLRGAPWWHKPPPPDEEITS